MLLCTLDESVDILDYEIIVIGLCYYDIIINIIHHSNMTMI